MKKIMVLLTVLVTALVFSTGAFADPCSTCKCPLRNIPCPVGGQIAATCFEFDYDLNTALDGYCTFNAANNCRAILKVCDCLPDPTAFVASLDVGVTMTILVNGLPGDRGAYWSNSTGAAGTGIAWDHGVTQALACGLAAQTLNFGPEVYYLSDEVTVVAPAALPVDPACTVAAGSRATILVASSTSALSGVNGKLIGTEGEYWWIDIPAIRIDPALIASGATVQVKVELTDDAGTTICGGCTLCTCIIDVAQVCCAAAAPATNLTFPYFASNASFWRGIAITNPSGSAGTITLTLHDTAGNTATATVSAPAGGLFVDSVDNIAWAGAANVNGRSFITATCNYGGALGFAMMGDGDESMGYIVP